MIVNLQSSHYFKIENKVRSLGSMGWDMSVKFSCSMSQNEWLTVFIKVIQWVDKACNWNQKALQQTKHEERAGTEINSKVHCHPKNQIMSKGATGEWRMWACSLEEQQFWNDEDTLDLYLQSLDQLDFSMLSEGSAWNKRIIASSLKYFRLCHLA